MFEPASTYVQCTRPQVLIYDLHKGEWNFRHTLNQRDLFTYAQVSLQVVVVTSQSFIPSLDLAKHLWKEWGTSQLHK